jgi:hypothetical protein
MWNIKCFVIPVITDATGILTKGIKRSGINIRKAVSSFSKKKKKSCTMDIAHNNKEST